MRAVTGVDGLMVSRGALGNPWVFVEVAGSVQEVSVDEWVNAVEKITYAGSKRNTETLVLALSV